MFWGSMVEYVIGFQEGHWSSFMVIVLSLQTQRAQESRRLLGFRNRKVYWKLRTSYSNGFLTSRQPILRDLRLQFQVNDSLRTTNSQILARKDLISKLKEQRFPVNIWGEFESEFQNSRDWMKQWISLTRFSVFWSLLQNYIFSSSGWQGSSLRLRFPSSRYSFKTEAAQ